MPEEIPAQEQVNPVPNSNPVNEMSAPTATSEPTTSEIPISDISEKKSHLPLVILILVLILIAIGAAGYFYMQMAGVPNGTTNTTTPTPQQQNNNQTKTSPTTTIQQKDTTNNDLPPLYPDLDWEATESGEFEFRTKDGDLINLDGVYFKSKETSEYPDAFIDYYMEELTKLGWEENLAAQASGLGGGSYGYIKDYQYLEFSVYPTKGEPGEEFEAYRASLMYTASTLQP